MLTEFKKYKRVFAFGCSFTSYIYPTWADIIHQSCNENVEFHNLGRSGAGNMFIANRLTEANRYFKFNENDLILIMWSTYCRIDCYKSGEGWTTPGNIYTQDNLPLKELSILTDPNGFLLRDFSIIDLTTQYLKTLPCDCLKLMSVPLDYNRFQDILEDKTTDRIIETYKDLANEYPQTLFEFLGKHFPSEIKYNHPQRGDMVDYHPTPVHYCDYLLAMGIPLTNKSIEFAKESLAKIHKYGKTQYDIINLFPDCDKRYINGFRELIENCEANLPVLK